MAGIAALHALVADHLAEDAEPDEVVVGIETDRGPWVQALLAAGYTRLRDQPAAGGPLPGTPRHLRARRAIPGMRTCWPSWCAWTGRITARSPGTPTIAEHVKVLARAHQSMIWSRQRQTNTLRSMLREYYPAALAAFGTTWPAGTRSRCSRWPRPRDRAARLTEHQVAAALRRAGRQRNITDPRERIVAGAARTSSWPPAPAWSTPTPPAAQALVAVITELARQITVLQSEVEAGFGRHPDAEIYLSQPGLGRILGARVLAEFGDDPHRYADAEGPQELLRHRPDHPSLRQVPGRAGPLRPQPAPGRRPLPAGLRRPEQPHPAPAPTTTPTAPAATPTTKPYAPWPTASSASSTAASATTPPTTKPSPGQHTQTRPPPQLDHLRPWDV